MSSKRKRSNVDADTPRAKRPRRHSESECPKLAILDTMPHEILVCHIIPHLTPRDRSAMSCLSHGWNNMLGQEALFVARAKAMCSGRLSAVRRMLRLRGSPPLSFPANLLAWIKRTGLARECSDNALTSITAANIAITYEERVAFLVRGKWTYSTFTELVEYYRGSYGLDALRAIAHAGHVNVKDIMDRAGVLGDAKVVLLLWGSVNEVSSGLVAYTGGFFSVATGPLGVLDVFVEAARESGCTLAQYMGPWKYGEDKPALSAILYHAIDEGALENVRALLASGAALDDSYGDVNAVLLRSVQTCDVVTLTCCMEAMVPVPAGILTVLPSMSVTRTLHIAVTKMTALLINAGAEVRLRYLHDSRLLPNLRALKQVHLAGVPLVCGGVLFSTVHEFLLARGEVAKVYVRPLEERVRVETIN